MSPRRPGQASDHVGEYWLGSYERDGDAPTGELESEPFEVTHPFASFLVGGGPHHETRVEVIDLETGRSDQQHPLLNSRLVGGQLNCDQGSELTFPVPTPGSEAVLQGMDGKGRMRLQVTSRVGEGSTFTVRLPALGVGHGTETASESTPAVVGEQG